MSKLIFYVFAVVLGLFQIACKSTSRKDDSDSLKADTLKTIQSPSVWERTKHSNIYEVNIRQYTPEGTFKAFEAHIPRLKKMGTDILWLMPIYPISEKNRKGSKGSYYAVADYKKINPEFGTKEDLRSLIKTAHDNEMLVILDWVANHTGWNNPWITEHPEWYTQDKGGNPVIPEGTDWTDVADLNYDNKEMRAAMTHALEYWVREFDIDGYRCDVAGMVPTDFWNNVRSELEAIRPVFMLAEAEQLDLHEHAFDMGYAWDLHHIMNDIASGEKTVTELARYFEKAKTEYPKGVYRMAFTSNHDENSWNGTVFERMPDSYKTWAALSFVVPGMPLIYSGQEAGLNKRLKFFDKDEIEWKDTLGMTELYSELIALKNSNKALWNGEYGGDMNIIRTSEPDKIFAFERVNGNNKVIAVFNLSKKPVKFKTIYPAAKVTDYFTGEELDFNPDSTKRTKFEAWEYKIYIVK